MVLVFIDKDTYLYGYTKYYASKTHFVKFTKTEVL